MSDIVPTKKDDLSSGVTEPRPPWPGWMMSILIAAHVLAGVALVLYSLAFYPRRHTYNDFLFSLILCQCGLVGLWGAMGGSRPVVRIVGILAAIGYFGTELSLAKDYDVNGGLCTLVLMVILPVAAFLGIVRHFTATMRRVDEPGVARKGLQFSIRSLILLTIVIACLLMLGRWFAPYLVGMNWTLIFVLAIFFVSVALTSIWAMLDQDNPVIRCLLVIALSATMDWTLKGIGESPGYPIRIMLQHAIILLGSLIVVRGCGYRLSAKTSVVPAHAAVQRFGAALSQMPQEYNGQSESLGH